MGKKESIILCFIIMILVVFLNIKTALAESKNADTVKDELYQARKMNAFTIGIQAYIWGYGMVEIEKTIIFAL